MRHLIAIATCQSAGTQLLGTHTCEMAGNAPHFQHLQCKLHVKLFVQIS